MNKDKVFIQEIVILYATSLRIPLKERKDGLYYYDVRHDDECLGIPVTISDMVFVGHYCTIVTEHPLKFNRQYDLSNNEADLIQSVVH